MSTNENIGIEQRIPCYKGIFVSVIVLTIVALHFISTYALFGIVIINKPDYDRTTGCPPHKTPCHDYQKMTCYKNNMTTCHLFGLIMFVGIICILVTLMFSMYMLCKMALVVEKKICDIITSKKDDMVPLNENEVPLDSLICDE